ncbi:DJ-1/PfpI family protein [Ottowia oryzae]
MTAQTLTLTVHILAFDGVEALDFAGPYEVFTTATRMHQRLAPTASAVAPAPPLFDVRAVAAASQPVRVRAGLRLLPELDFHTAPPCDGLIVPGGVVDGALACPRTLAWLRKQSARAQITASVCTGAFLLAEAGVLTDQEVTTHWEDLADLQRRYPALRVTDRQRCWVDGGRLVTSAGISAGIDMSLHLVARLGGPALAERTARQMDYAWQAA